MLHILVAHFRLTMFFPFASLQLAFVASLADIR